MKKAPNVNAKFGWHSRVAIVKKSLAKKHRFVLSSYLKHAPHLPSFMRTLWFRVVSLAIVFAIILPSISTLIINTLKERTYTLNEAESSLVGTSTIDTTLIKESDTAILYNRAEEASPSDVQKVLELAANKEDATGKKPYQAELSKDPKEGITFSDSKGERSITLKPLFNLATPRLDEGRVVYPETATERHVYTFKKNGIKSDIVLSEAPGSNEQTYSWNLSYSGNLTAKPLPNGGIGIYSTDPLLYGDLQVGDQKSQELLDNARANGEKNYLVFELPAPFIVSSNGDKNYQDVSYRLNKLDNTLNLDVKNLDNQSYPLSIDPTITVTTTSDFRQNIGDTSNTDYSTDGEIRRGSIGSGAVGATTQQTSAFTNARYGHTSVTYNGYLYIVGGCSAGNCTTRENDIQYCPINSDGSIGTCTRQTSAFTTARENHTSVVNNGYLYIIGGTSGSNLNDIHYCPINSNGSVGTCTQQTSAFTTARQGHTSVVFNGYLYIVGGCSDTSCSTTYLNDIQYCPINANGSVGTCTQQTSAFTTARSDHGSVVYNSYLYIVGGYNGGYLNDIHYCPINSSGSVGTCTQQTSAFTTARPYHTVTTNNGYLYIVGGYNAGYLNDILFCPIGSTGSVGTCTQQTAAFTTGRANHASVIYNGYLYVIGGYDGGTHYNDIQRLPLGQGRISTWASTTSFTTARKDHTTVAYNGYLYVIGGFTGTWQSGVQYAPINSDGTVGTWTATTSISNARRYHTSVAYNGYLYVIGGDSSIGPRNDIEYAAIASNGTVGTWFTTTSFTTARYSHSTAMYGSYIYIIGGTDGTRKSDVQYGTIASNGTIASWTTTTAISSGRESHTSVAYNGYLYMIGGSNGFYQNDVQYAAIASNGTVGTWATTTSFTTARTSHKTEVHGGYMYIIGGTDGTRRNDVQYAAIASNGTVGTWATTTSFTTARDNHGTAVYNGYIYVIGGCSSGACSAYQSDVQYARIGSADGRVNAGSWTATTSFTTARHGHSSVVYNGYIYIIGGLGGSYLNDVQYAAIASNGTVGTWASTTSFTTARWVHTSVAYNGYMYVIGGNNGPYLNDVQYAAIASNGTVGTWASTTSFTTARADHTSVAYNGYMYVIGGYNASYQNDVQYAAIASNGTVGTWASTTSFTTARYRHNSVIYNGYMYVIGGYGGSYLNDVQYAAIASNGTVGTWASTTSFTTARWQFTTAIHNGYLYVIGGNNGSDLNGVQYAPVNNNGTVGTWASTTSFTTARFSHTSVAYNGYLYISGGYTTVPLADVQYAPVSAVADIARYERTIDSGAGGNTLNTFTISGNASCNYRVDYKIAGSDGIYGSTTTLLNVYPGVVQTITSTSKRYVSIVVVLNDASCGGQSSISGISLNYNGAPDVPTLLLPETTTTNHSNLPEFRLGSADDIDTYIRYSIEVCSTSDCSSIVRTIDQTSSQTGWISQSAQSGTAYPAGSTITQYAVHQYQPTALTANTQYWWRARAIDPGGTNQWSSYSTTYTFTTGDTTRTETNIGGGTTLYGGTNISTGN